MTKINSSNNNIRNINDLKQGNIQENKSYSYLPNFSNYNIVKKNPKNSQ